MGCIKSKEIHLKLVPGRISQKYSSTTRKDEVTAVTISKYKFDQTVRTVEITVAISGIQNHPKGKISLSASEFAFDFRVKKLKGENLFLSVVDLAHEIDPSKISFAVNNDTVTLRLTKKYFSEWSSLTALKKHSVNEAFLNDEAEQNLETAKKLKEIGNQFHCRGFYDEAIQKYSQAINLAPNSSIYYSNRAASLMMMKKYCEALEDATKAIEYDKSYTKGYLRKGKIENILGHGKSALSTLRLGLEIDSNDIYLRDEMNKATNLISSVSFGDKAFQDANFEEANKCYKASFSVASGSSELLFKKLEAMLYCGECAEVLLLLQDLPDDSDWHYIMALLNYIKCDKNYAFLHINKTLGKDPKHSKGNALKCKMQIIFKILEESKMSFQEGDFDKAQIKLEKIIKLDPNNKILNAEVIGTIGLCFMKKEKYLKASEFFTRSMALKATSVMYLNRATCFEHLGRVQESLNDYEQLYNLNPTHDNKKFLDNAKLNVRKSRVKDYYGIFGLQQDASPEDIRKAYQKFVAKFQPDYFSFGTEKNEEERRYREANEAYFTLTDPLKRERYDEISTI